MLNSSMQLSTCDGGFICGSIEWGYRLSGAVVVLLCGGSLRRGLRWPVVGWGTFGWGHFLCVVCGGLLVAPLGCCVGDCGGGLLGGD